MKRRLEKLVTDLRIICGLTDDYNVVSPTFPLLHTDAIHFNREAEERNLNFAKASDSLWKANFRYLNSSLIRMATLATGGRIDLNVVEDEIARLMKDWYPKEARGNEGGENLFRFLDSGEYRKSIFSNNQLDSCL